jgi:S-adenosylmethionine uptake transporter
MIMTQSQTLRGAMFALAAFGVYATHDVIVKFLGAHYSSFQVIFFSCLMSFPLVTFLLMGDKTDGNLIPKHPWWTAIRSISAVVNGGAGFYAFSQLPLAQCYAIFFAMPLLITLLAIPILGEKVGLRRGIAVGVGLIGVIIVLRPGSADLALGHAAALLAALSGSLTSVLVRKIGPDERSVVLILYPMVLTFLVMGLTLPFVYVPMEARDLGLTAVLALFGMCGGLLIIRAYRAAPAIIVAPMQYSQIVWAAIYGYLFFNETIDSYTLVGTAVIIASGLYIVLREGTASVSENTPVLQSRTRLESGTFPRISLLLGRSSKWGRGGRKRAEKRQSPLAKDGGSV